MILDFFAGTGRLFLDEHRVRPEIDPGLVLKDCDTSIADFISQKQQIGRIQNYFTHFQANKRTFLTLFLSYFSG
jgi:hypothetical protein